MVKLTNNNKSEWGSIWDQLKIFVSWKLNFKQNKYDREWFKNE